MQFHRYVYILFLLLFIGNTAKQPQKSHQKKSPITMTATPKHAIIFDLTNVLFQENQIGFAKKIGYGVLASYAITHWRSPGYRCLDMLAAISTTEEQKPHVCITLKDRTMPRCIVELQEGTKNCYQTKTEITHSIEQLDKAHFFSSAKEKNLMITIMNLILDPQVVATVTEPIKHTVQLVQKLKNMGHPCYLCANAPEELYSTIATNNPDIIKLFDGAVISYQVKKLKPDIAVLNHLLTTHKLNPKECILIDDLASSVATAEKLGLRGIVHDKISHVTQKLKRYGVKI